MLTVLGGLAEFEPFERELIRARTSEGRARAKARGQSLGRPHKLTLHQRREALQRKDAGEPVRDIARSYAVAWFSSTAAAGLPPVPRSGGRAQSCSAGSSTAE